MSEKIIQDLSYSPGMNLHNSTHTCNIKHKKLYPVFARQKPGIIQKFYM